MEDNYSKAYKEVIEILNFVPKESVDKIPQAMLNTFKANVDENYDFKIDINTSFEEQELLDETKAILANIFRDYWATPYQKVRIEEKEKHDRQIIEEEKRVKYSTDIFNKGKTENYTIYEQKEPELNNLPIEVKKERFYHRIIRFFRKMFHIEGE